MTGSVGTMARAGLVMLMTALMFLTEGRSAGAASAIQGELALVGGYREDALDWNIGGYLEDQLGNPHYVNVLSELTWRDLRIYQFGLTGSAEIVGPEFTAAFPCMRAALGFGQIVSGKNQDSDYAGNHRTLEFSSSNNSADDGSVFDLSLAGGGKFHFRDHRYTLAPLLGFAYYTQNLTMQDGRQTVSNPALFPGVPPTGPFPGLRSTYEAAWYGPWLGLDATAVPGQGWSLTAGVELHQVFYIAEANWNLRTDLAHPKSFEHKGDGYGLIFRLASRYALTPRLELTLDADLRSFAVRDGTDRVFFADGSQGATRLNEVNWESKMLTAGLLYHY